jgi:hypothetical protein
LVVRQHNVARGAKVRPTSANGIAVLLLAGLFLGIPRGDPPPKTELTQITGQLRYLKGVGRLGRLNAVRFGLITDARDFRYESKSGAADHVFQALEHAPGSLVSILVDAADVRSPWFEEISLHPVYEVRIEEKTVRSYEEVLRSWRNQDKLGLWVGYGALASGVIFLLFYVRERRAA